MVRPGAVPRARVYGLRLMGWRPEGLARGQVADDFVAAIARNLPRHVYVAVTLFAGDVIFDEIGMLQAHEFDGEAIFDMTDHTALRFADSDHDADRRPQLGRDSDSRT